MESHKTLPFSLIKLENNDSDDNSAVTSDDKLSEEQDVPFSNEPELDEIDTVIIKEESAYIEEYEKQFSDKPVDGECGDETQRNEDSVAEIFSYEARNVENGYTSSSIGEGRQCSQIKNGGKTFKVKKRYICPECKQAFQFLCHLERHRRMHTGEKPFTCTICSKAFPETYKLKIHMRVHTGERPFTCTQCPKAFSILRRLKEHLKIHTGEKPFICTQCSKAFSLPSHLKQHMKIHTRETFACSHCPRTFLTPERLRLHMRMHPDAIGCSSSSNDKNSFYLSSKVEVKSEPEECSFGPPSIVKNEIENKPESGEGNFEYPRKGTSPLNDYNSQICDTVVNIKRRNFLLNMHKCIDCGKTFETKRLLVTHIRTHTGEKPFKCSECGKAFTQRGHLSEHRKVHTGERNFKCQECGIYLTNKSNLKRHMKTHTGEKPFKCADCGKAFAEKEHLRTHIMIHSGERPFQCGICGKALARKYELKKHMKVHSAFTSSNSN